MVATGLLAVLGGGASEAQVVYDITRLTNNTVEDVLPSLNDNGDIAFTRNDAGGRRVYFYDRSAGTATPISAAGAALSPALNNNGVIAYSLGGDIYTYNTNTAVTTNLTNSATVENSPKINDAGDVAYLSQGAGSDPNLYEIMERRASDGVTLNVSNDSVWEPGNFDINSEGDVVWSRNNGSCTTPPCSLVPGGNIWFFDRSAGTRTQITNDSIADIAPVIGDNGNLFWTTFTIDFNDQYHERVKLRNASNGQISFLTDDAVDGNFNTAGASDVAGQSPLNASGDLALTKVSASGSIQGIWVRAGASGQFTQVAAYSGGQAVPPSPVINASGWVAWADGNEIYLAIPRPACVTEICDGIDNDCDGQIDEGFGLGDSCTVGVGACQRTGQIICSTSGGTRCSATPGTGTGETCNGIDDDCDGTVDDGFNVGTACSVGVGQCLRNGTRICNAQGNGTLCNATPGSPVSESCNGLDDDCDGTADDGNPGGGAACPTGVPGACATGVLTCSAAALICTQTVFPVTEICNGVDDDCDGSIDEDASNAPTWYADADGDGYGNPLVTQSRCTQPAGYVANAQDCDDANPALGICNTPVGQGPVTVDDPAGAASVTLPNVTSPGNTSVSSGACAAPPVGIFVPPNAVCVQITTTASFSGNAEVCIHYSDTGLTLAQEQSLRMVRYPDAAGCAAQNKAFPCPEGLPTTGPLPGPPPGPDTTNNVLCAATSGFSNFAVGIPTDVDGDFVPDIFDNCPLVVNFFQEDADSDKVGDACDNCRAFANPTQADVDANGIGNACECGDQNGDGRVNVQDLIAINLAIFNPALVTPLCDTNNDGRCNVSDIVGANLKIFGRPAYCSRYPPP